MSEEGFQKFSDLPVSADTKKALAEHGFVTPTPIQKLVLPDALAGRDVFGQAQTGTGKTLAFAIPIVEKISLSEKSVQAVVLVPTRELAKQVANEIGKVAGGTKGISVVAIYGGVGQQPQAEALAAGAQIVVGTPGRVVDLMRQKVLRIGAAKIAVLDEVDEMLDMGFYDEVHSVISAMPKTRQTMFFSATIPPRIQKMGRSYLHREVIHTTSEANLLLDTTSHVFYEVSGRDRIDGLSRVIDCEDFVKALIFTNTKIEADRVCHALERVGYPVEGLHGDLPQAKRESVMARFREGKTAIVVATDVAARGLDVRDVTVVFHYHIPLDPETFVHRTGRTGRAGAAGKSILLVSPAEYHDLFKIQQANSLAIQNLPLPTAEQAFARRMDKMFDKIMKGLEKEDISAVYREMKKHVPLFKRGKALAYLVKKCTEGGFRFGTTPVAATATGARSESGSSEGGRLFINIGRRHGVTEGDLKDFLVKEGGVKASSIDRIDFKDGYSHVTVDAAVAGAVVEKASGKKIGRYAVKIEIARPREDGARGPRDDRGGRGRDAGRDGGRSAGRGRDDRGGRDAGRGSRSEGGRDSRPAPHRERSEPSAGVAAEGGEGRPERTGVRVRRGNRQGGHGSERHEEGSAATGAAPESRNEVEINDETNRD